MSHIDTFDPKPDRPDIQGDVGVIKQKLLVLFLVNT